MKKLIFILVFFLCGDILIAKNFQLKSDTLNKLDSLGRRIGYWEIFLSENLRVVKKVEKATFYAYARYSDGVCFDFPIVPKGYVGKIMVGTKDTLFKKNGLFLLDGNYKLYKRNKTKLLLECVFKKGILQSETIYDYGGRYDILLFTEKYNEKEFSYETSSYSISGKLQSTIIAILKNGKWRTVKKDIKP